MNSKNISQSKLLKVSKRVLKRDGFKKLSIRNIAKEAEVSVGSIYKYFPTKTDILIAIASDSWNKILILLEENKASSIEDTVENIYQVLKKVNSPTDGLINHTRLFSSSDISKAGKTMRDYQNKIRIYLNNGIKNDTNLTKELEDKELNNIIDLIFDTLIQDISKNTKNYKTLLILIKKYLQ